MEIITITSPVVEPVSTIMQRVVQIHPDISMSMGDPFVIGGLASASTPPSTSLVVDVLTDKNSAAKDLGVLNISSDPPNSIAPMTAQSSWWSAVPTVRCTRLPESAQASRCTG